MSPWVTFDREGSLPRQGEPFEPRAWAFITFVSGCSGSMVEESMKESRREWNTLKQCLFNFCFTYLKPSRNRWPVTLKSLGEWTLAPFFVHRWGPSRWGRTNLQAGLVTFLVLTPNLCWGLESWRISPLWVGFSLLSVKCWFFETMYRDSQV